MPSQGNASAGWATCTELEDHRRFELRPQGLRVPRSAVDASGPKSVDHRILTGARRAEAHGGTARLRLSAPARQPSLAARAKAGGPRRLRSGCGWFKRPVPLHSGLRSGSKNPVCHRDSWDVLLVFVSLMFGAPSVCRPRDLSLIGTALCC
jgi:hypothetical protein